MFDFAKGKSPWAVFAPEVYEEDIGLVWSAIVELRGDVGLLSDDEALDVWFLLWKHGVQSFKFTDFDEFGRDATVDVVAPLRARLSHVELTPQRDNEGRRGGR